MADAHGPRVAFDTELCHAVAVAILGPQAHVAIKGYPDNDTALDALRNHEVDLVASVSDDFSHSTLPAISLTQPVLLDAQGFLVLRSANIHQPEDLNNKKVCVLEDTEAEDVLRFYFAQHHLAFNPYPFQEEGEMEAAFVTGNCAALSGDLTRLANTRVAIGAQAKDYVILPATIAPDPLAAAYRTDDPTLGNILRATINLLLAAESAGVTQSNAATLAASKDLDPIRRRLLGQTHELGNPLTLDESWPLHVLTATGNYAEIYNRTLGSNSPLHLALPAPQPLPLK
jgi:general L-amino acid transport system substrate-binding protein